jgi:MFS transporter, DHA2 family, methylenomycin A resistance protein
MGKPGQFGRKRRKKRMSSDTSRERSSSFYAGVIALIAICQVIFGTDFCAVNVALASIARDLRIEPAIMAWVVATYSLAYSGFLVLGGRAADSYGRRRFCIFGLCLFGVGTVLAALSFNVWILIGARALEGLGSAFLIPTSFSLINVLLPEGPVRHRAFSVFSITQGVAMTLGLCVGGFLTTNWGWRSVFLLNVPLVLTAIVLSWRFIPPYVRSSTKTPLDLGGAVLITTGIALALLSLSAMGEYGWTSRQGLGLVAAAIVVVALFLVLESRLRAPLVPLSVFWFPNLLGADVASVGIMATTGGLFVLLNLFMQRMLHFSAMMSGLGMLPYALAVMAGGRLVEHGMSRYPLRWSILWGFVVFIAGTLLFSFVSVAAGYGLNLVPGMLVCGLGSTIGSILLMALSTASVPSNVQGVATGVLITFQQLGLALGVSVAITVQAASLAHGATEIASFHEGFLSATVMAVIGFLCALLLTRRSHLQSADSPQSEKADFAAG